MAYQIEKNVSIPTKTVTRDSKYPFKEMEVGDSFFADNVKSSTMSNTAGRFAKTHEGYKFSVRAEGSGARVWRVEAGSAE